MDAESTPQPEVTLRRTWQATDIDTPDLLSTARFEFAVFTHRAPGKDQLNEDGALVLAFDDGRALVAVADGIGGHAAGERASAAALDALAEEVVAALSQGRGLRAGIVDGFDLAHSRVAELSGNGGTTLIAIALEDGEMRPFHVGDSAALVTGQRGRIKHVTSAHSPVGYAMEAGLLDEEQAIVHEDRHLVSNAIGLGPMKIEIGPVISLAARDTLVLGSDGLFDNLRIDEIADSIRKGRMNRASRVLGQRATDRMQTDDPEHPSKPDDLTFVVVRCRPMPAKA